MEKLLFLATVKPWFLSFAARFFAGMKKAVHWLLVASIALPVLAWADRARPPYDYIVDVGDGRHVFVMLATPGGSVLDAGAPDDVGVADRDAKIRRNYKTSGLYPKGSKMPLWSVSWYAFEVYPDSDGVHLVRMGPWASSMDQLAVAFYAGGVVLRQYLIRDLIRNPALLRPTVSHFSWLAHKSFDDKANLLLLETVDGLVYKFSTATGEIIQ